MNTLYIGAGGGYTDLAIKLHRRIYTEKMNACKTGEI